MCNRKKNNLFVGIASMVAKSGFSESVRMRGKGRRDGAQSTQDYCTNIKQKNISKKNSKHIHTPHKAGEKGEKE